MINVCTAGRILRIIIGLTLITMAITGYVGFWGWFGLIPLVAGILGWCPVNKLIGMKDCNIKFKASTS